MIYIHKVKLCESFIYLNFLNHLSNKNLYVANFNSLYFESYYSFDVLSKLLIRKKYAT